MFSSLFNSQVDSAFVFLESFHEENEQCFTGCSCAGPREGEATLQDLEPCTLNPEPLTLYPSPASKKKGTDPGCMACPGYCSFSTCTFQGNYAEQLPLWLC